MNRRVLALIGLLLCSTAYAAGTSIWNATDRGTVAATDRLPVATSSSSGPLYVTPLTLQSYLLSSSATTEVLANNAGAFDGDSGFTFNATTNIATLTGGLGLGGSADVFIVRAAAGAASFRNGTTAQTVRVTDTYTDDSNGAYLELNAGAAGDWLQIRGVTNGTAGDNYGIALTPTGTGAISAQVPDSTVAGGNARGANAVDWQSATRTAATQVASGTNSIVFGGDRNTASGTGSAVGGSNSTASGSGAFAFGSNNSSSGLYSITMGQSNNASATNAVSLGYFNSATGLYSWNPGGQQATTRGLVGAGAYSAGQRSAAGDAQVILQPVRRTTTDATPVSLATNGTPAATTVMVLPASSTLMCDAMVVAQSGAGTDNAGYKVSAVIQRDGASNTALVGAATTTTVAEDTAGMNATIIANDTLESAEIQVTGVAATTIQWMGELKCVQVL